MTGRDYKRIMLRLRQSAKVTREAYEIFTKANPGLGGDSDLRYILAKAADQSAQILKDVEHKEERDRMSARAMAAQMEDEGGMTDAQKQSYRRLRAAGKDREEAKRLAFEGPLFAESADARRTRQLWHQDAKP